MMTLLTALSLLGTAHADTPDSLEECLMAFAFESIDLDDGPVGHGEYGEQCLTDLPWHGTPGYVIIPPFPVDYEGGYESCIPFAYGITTCSDISDTN